MVRLRAVLLLGFALARLGVDAKKEKKTPLQFEQCCAARKLCNRPLEERDPALHAIPEGEDAPKGHLKPLGHPDFLDSWAGEIDVLTEISPKTFWTKYHPRKPFILKHFAKQSPAFIKWQDDDYLLKEFGQFKAKCENKNEDRLTDYCGQKRFGQKIKCGPETIPYVETHMKLQKFIPRYQTVEFDKYVVTQMPDAMAKDVIVPTFHSCAKRHPDDPGPKGAGPWMTQMYEHNFWLSHNDGNNFSTSVIHYDMNHQIMCQFGGTKEWIMWDLKKEAHKIPLWSNLYDQKRHTAQGSDDSPIDGERVDLLRYPEFAKAQWMNTTLEAGDCLYTPAKLLHYVRSWGRNIAAMTMFQNEEEFDPKCGEEPTPEPVPLSTYDVMWSFPEEDKSLLGWNLVKMGFPNWKRGMLWPLANKAKKANSGILTKKLFTDYMNRLNREANLKGFKKRLGDVWQSLDTDGDGSVPVKDIFNNRELRFVFKDLAVAGEGERGDQEEDVEVEHYDLQGNTKKNRMEL